MNILMVYSHYQVLAGRLLALLLAVALPLVAYPPHPGGHHQHQGVEAGHACTQRGALTVSGTSTARGRRGRPVLTRVEEKLDEILLV